MKILHIANYYSGSKVYMNLFRLLDRENEQVVYNAVRHSTLIDKNKFDFSNEKSRFIYSKILTNYTRVNFYAKIRRIYNNITEKVDVPKFDVMHAHTWYSDGSVAYEVYKKYGTPYVVTIRNTDINLFYRYMIHLRPFARKILSNASAIICISPAYKKRLDKLTKDIFANKTIVLPNGIDEYWFDNISKVKKELTYPIEVLFIGSFSKGKNIEKLIDALAFINDSGTQCNLSLIGGGGDNDSVIKKKIENFEWISHHGQINSKSILKEYFQTSDIFAMPSKFETFGLVYIEALSQYRPVLYSKDEGIDGFYRSNIGESVDPHRLTSIITGLRKIIENYDNYTFDPREILQNHNWIEITKEYNKLYNSIIKSNEKHV